VAYSDRAHPAHPRVTASIEGVLGPTRPLPRLGGSARIAHFGGGFEPGTIVAVHEEGRLLEVRGETGELYEFELNPATARFITAGAPHGPRLEVLAQSR